MAKASGGESGQHMTWTQAWNYAKSLPYELQKDMIFALNVEVYDFLAFATEAVQIEVLGAAPHYVIYFFPDKGSVYTLPESVFSILPASSEAFLLSLPSRLNML